VVVLVLTTACIQSQHGDGPSGPPTPGGEVRLLEDRPGRGRVVQPGDRIRVEFIGRYASGAEWARGPLTIIYGENTYPGADLPVRVGAVERMQYVVRPSDSTVRLLPFQGGDAENEFGGNPD